MALTKEQEIERYNALNDLGLQENRGAILLAIREADQRYWRKRAVYNYLSLYVEELKGLDRETYERLTDRIVRAIELTDREACA